MTVSTSDWQELSARYRALAARGLRALTAAAPDRVSRLSFDFEDRLLVDASKDLIDDDALEHLLTLARKTGLEDWRRRLFDGEHVNDTEQRPALHTLLRTPAGSGPLAEDPRLAEVHAVLERSGEFAERLRAGHHLGARGLALDTVVNLGIGGSRWGPELAIRALQPERGHGPRVHFISSVDGHAARQVLAACEPARTLFVVSSKSFTTAETALNLGLARDWLAAGGIAHADQGPHLVAVTANPERAQAQGFAPAALFPFRDWVGGRYSLWSAIGLPAQMALGAAAFRELLAGAWAMDRHFIDTPLSQNLPVLLGLLDVWHASAGGLDTRALLPYDSRLGLLPTWVQQLAMESNGKGVDRRGTPLAIQTSPIWWGGGGNDGQHTFYQLLHQGTRMVPVEFVVAAQDDEDAPAHRRALLANCLAQAQALLEGTDAGLEAHRACPGGRPSTTVLLRRIDAYTLGALLALYEHRIFVQSVLWDINPFDQWGVELGKKLAGGLEQALQGDGAAGLRLDASTRALVARVRDWQR